MHSSSPGQPSWSWQWWLEKFLSGRINSDQGEVSNADPEVCVWWNSSREELSSNDGLAQLISSLCEESTFNTVSVFPSSIAQPEPPAPGSLAVPVGSSQKKSPGRGCVSSAKTDAGLCNFVWKGIYSRKYMKAGSRFVTSFTVFPTTCICLLPFFYLSLVASPLRGKSSVGIHFSILKDSSNTCTKKGVGSYIISTSHRALLVPLAKFWCGF